MKRWKYLGAILTVASVPMVWASSSSAQMVVSKPIIITARVLPTHTIILDSQGNIAQIISNTTDKKPKLIKVYGQRVAKEAERPLTPELYAAYRQDIAKVKRRVGTLYTQTISTAALTNLKNAPLSPYLLTGKGLMTHQSSFVSESRI